MTENAPWYLIRACTRQEKRACESLKELGIEHYLPCETVERKLCREKVVVDRALFPGYLFARIPDVLFHAAINADGVHAPVRVTNAAGVRVPGMVPARLIRELQIAQAAGEFDRTIVPPERPLETGELLIVTIGAFQGRSGSFLEMRAADRIAVLFGGMVAELGIAEVERAA